MKNYCLNLMGIDLYRRKKDESSMVLNDVVAFSQQMSVSLVVNKSGVMLGSRHITIHQLADARSKKLVFNWIMERVGE